MSFYVAFFFLQSGRRATKAFLREYRQRKEKEKEKLNTPSIANQQSRVTVKVRCASNSPETATKVSRDRLDSSTSPSNKQRNSVTSVTSLESSLDEATARKGLAFRLPPLSQEKRTSVTNPPKTDREGSGDSVTSARKVDVDVGRSPRIGGRVNTRIGDISS